MRILSWRSLVTPKFSAPPSGQTMHQTPKCFGGARTCSRSSITMPSLVRLGFYPPLGRPKPFSFVCLSVRHAFERQSLCDQFRHEGVGVQKRFWCRWIGKDFVVVHPCPTFSDCCQLVTPLNAEVQKQQNWGFSPPEGDRINLSRWNLARKRTPWVCYSTPNLTVIGKRGSVQELPKVKICPKLWFLATGSWHNEHIQMKFGV